MERTVERVALAYSGGLDTSVMIPWLRERYGCEVVAVVADVGQEEDLEAVREKALATGAVECRVEDLRDAFARDYLFPALAAGAVYEGRYLLGTALARPLIAASQVRVARETGCDALAHGCTGKGNDQVRFELAYAALAPEMPVIAPWREWTLGSREACLAYAREKGVEVEASGEKLYSVDRNLWHTSHEGGDLEDAGAPAGPDVFDRVAPPGETPDEPAPVRVAFTAGRPVALDGEALDPLALIGRLNAIAGRHGVGRCDMVENRVVGLKSRGVYETPAGTVLRAALEDLESVTLDRETARFKRRVGERYADLVYEGKWFTPLRASLDAFVRTATRTVTGEVELELFKGSCRPVARTSPCSLYREELATFGESEGYDHADAGGFLRLWALPTRVHAAVHGPPVAPGGGSGSAGGTSRPGVVAADRTSWQAPWRNGTKPAEEEATEACGAGASAPASTR